MTGADICVYRKLYLRTGYSWARGPRPRCITCGGITNSCGFYESEAGTDIFER